VCFLVVTAVSSRTWGMIGGAPVVMVQWVTARLEEYLCPTGLSYLSLNDSV
jgi:hypothetical protein